MQIWAQRAGSNGIHELAVMVDRVLSPGFFFLSQPGVVGVGGEANTD